MSANREFFYGKSVTQIDNALKEQGYQTTIRKSFDGVYQFTCPDEVLWEQISIIQASIEDDGIKFALMNDITDGYLDIIIKCKTISVN